MDEIVFVTHNKGKIASANRKLKDVNFKVFEYELDEPRSDDIKYISKYKVMEAYKLVNKPCISMDTGFWIDELGGFPKAFVNFALDTIGIDGILKLMEGKENRKCRFQECLAFHDGKEIRYFYGEHEGVLTCEVKGKDRKEKWSDLWYIFQPIYFNKTLAEMNEEEREARRKIDGSKEALQEFANWYEVNDRKV